MFPKKLLLALALASAASAVPTNGRRDDCQTTYNGCVAAGTADVVCSCRLTECLGEDDAREREYCSSATASLARSTTAPLAQPTTTAEVEPCQATYNACISDSIPEVVCSCRLTECLGEDDARQREYCSSETVSLGPFPTPTSIPGGCNPAHPGSCPSSYFTYPTITATPTPTAA